VGPLSKDRVALGIREGSNTAPLKASLDGRPGTVATSGPFVQCTISAKAAGTVAPQATAARRPDVRIVMHVCRLFDAPWRFTVKTVDTSSVLLRSLPASSQSPCTPVFRARQGRWRSPLDQALREIAQVEAEIRSRRGADDRAARDASGQSGPASRAARQVTAVRQVPFCEPQ